MTARRYSKYLRAVTGGPQPGPPAGPGAVRAAADSEAAPADWEALEVTVGRRRRAPGRESSESDSTKAGAGRSQPASRAEAGASESEFSESYLRGKCILLLSRVRNLVIILKALLHSYADIILHAYSMPFGVRFDLHFLFD